ncbi:MAG TPA: cytochrome D1 domain-containing protein [Zoogloea sp.]|uniref:cytochrome D1 domain-containing protein n=1 Tax=Zoogloea sp. TaxID=49181 RepID=UPI002C8FC458|nr:cytochrome D1 domain-containing protein [Zoogloea sp.]HMV18565.1 cytochrome D1 domain-containing protein [Rhodocyclaceae bacterium]HMZ77679.1 cytochrome D1 domain-containing protein [Rhodocyclaceae bacterium]HNA69169.1 cytochrome D1 domain-containing protein [Rhodocyclaceae bacterium]HNE16246.1 cytochrome D1 domain-containing protein [Rhodocyclaceae bacterium]HNF62069.1 cytochrome D1 domain-containing protein [Rhodocyclaceae bacterium]
MKTLHWLSVAALALGLTACAAPASRCDELRGTGDLGVIIERASGQVQVVEHSGRTSLGRVDGLGDLSHAHVAFSRDGRYAYVFGRDGGLTKVDLLTRRIARRVVQAGNSIGGAVSQDGRVVVAQNYEPGGIKAFDADTLELLADVPAEVAPGRFSRVVGLADAPGRRFVYALFDGDEIRVSDFSDPRHPVTTRYPAGRQPYDGLVTPDGRYFLAGLFGEDGVSLLDLWQPEKGVTRILAGYGRGEEKLPVFKMPHLRGWSLAAGQAWLPAVGRHEVLAVDTRTWAETARIPVKGQPVFVMARPDGRQIWVNFAFPDNDWVQVIDTVERRVIHSFSPGKAVLHLEFTPRGEEVWISSRDSDRVSVVDTATFATRTELPAAAPSGIFFTARGQRIGF